VTKIHVADFWVNMLGTLGAFIDCENKYNFRMGASTLVQLASLITFFKRVDPSQQHGCHADVFGQADGRTDDRTMPAGASVTWTHCSVLFGVTWGKTRCVRADAGVRPCGRISLPPLPSPPLPSPPLPSPSLPSTVRADTKKKIIIIFIFILFLFYF
jgi:hypothetical protein